jgi:hypothetical protein
LLKDGDNIVGMVAPIQLEDEELILAMCTATAKHLIVHYDFTGPLTCEFTLVRIGDEESLMQTDILPFLTKYHMDCLQVKYYIRDIIPSGLELVHVPPLEQEPKYEYLKMLKDFNLV